LIVAVIVAWFKLPTLQVLDVTSDVLDWSLRIQAFLPAVFFLAIAFLLFLHKLPVKRFRYKLAHSAGIVCLLAAIVSALTFGRFLSGHGSDIEFGPFPEGIPVNAIANMDPQAPWDDRKAALKALVAFIGDWHDSEPGQRPGRREFEQRVAPALLNVSKCPDFVMDHGHDYEFIRNMSDEDKAELIALLKTF
jgi:hypothetical protein